MRLPPVSLRLLLVITACAAAGCATSASSPLQRQAMETTYVEADFPTVFRATRTVFQNDGYVVEQSEFASGFLQFSREVPDRNPAVAAALGLLPGGGSFYVGHYGLGVFDLLLWPISVIWDIPTAAAAASESRKTIRASVTMVDLEDQTEVRVGFSGAPLDSEYAVGLKRLFAEVQRQVMIRNTRTRRLPAGAGIEEEETPATESP